MTFSTRRISLNLLLSLFFFSTPLLSAQASSAALMSDEEIARHTAKMAQLEGQEREDYRNAQYQMLVQRAKQQGYDMPATPPWQTAAKPTSTVSQAPASDVATPSSAPKASDTAAAHAAMREKMRAHREALLQAANTPPSAVDVPTVATSSETVEPAASSTAEPAPPGQNPQPAVIPVKPAASSPVTAAAPAPQTDPAPVAAASADDAVNAEVEPAAMARAQPPASPTAPQPPVAPTPPMQSGSQPNSAATMNAYREQMRSRFDAYMQERQAQMDQMAQQQREQRESARVPSRPVSPMQPGAAPARPMPYGYPNMPAYGPRYPSAYPGYRTPYWQQ